MIVIGRFEFVIKGYNYPLKKLAFINCDLYLGSLEHITVAKDSKFWKKYTKEYFNENIIRQYPDYHENIFNDEICDINYELTIIIDGLVCKYVSKNDGFEMVSKYPFYGTHAIKEVKLNDQYYCYGLDKIDKCDPMEYLADDMNNEKIKDYILSLHDEDLFNSPHRLLSTYYRRDDIEDMIKERSIVSHILTSEDSYIRITIDFVLGKIYKSKMRSF